jgi:sulfur carrier protein ThiS
MLKLSVADATYIEDLVANALEELRIKDSFVVVIKNGNVEIKEESDLWER